MKNEWVPVEVRKTPDKLGEYLVEYNNESLVWHKVLTWFPADFGPYKAGWHDLNDILDTSINHVEDMVAWMPIIWCSEEGKKRIHPTQKPVGLMGYILKDFTKDGDSVVDCFGGSGSTLIACEQLNRKCYMIELSPEYCDVIVKRWENLTGRKAVKLET